MNVLRYPTHEDVQAVLDSRASGVSAYPSATALFDEGLGYCPACVHVPVVVA